MVINGEMKLTVNERSTFPQRVKTQGRIVIPQIVREALSINEGDLVTVTVQKTKEVSG